MEFKDYYKVMGVARDATEAQIKQAYRKLARKYHPDVSKEKDAEARFKEVGEAYEVLKSAEKRAAYDQLGSHRQGQDFQPPPDWGRQHGDAPFRAMQRRIEGDEQRQGNGDEEAEEAAPVRRASAEAAPVAADHPRGGAADRGAARALPPHRRDVQNVLRNLALTNRVELARYAIEQGLESVS